MKLSQETRDLCGFALSMVASDIEMSGPSSQGICLTCSDAQLREITKRWPKFRRYILPVCECGMCPREMKVPAADAPNVVRTLARAAMN